MSKLRSCFWQAFSKVIGRYSINICWSIHLAHEVCWGAKGETEHPFNLTSGITESHVCLELCSIVFVLGKPSAWQLSSGLWRQALYLHTAPIQLNSWPEIGQIPSSLWWHFAQSVARSFEHAQRSWGLFIWENLKSSYSNKPHLRYNKRCISHRRVDWQLITVMLHL